MTSPPWTTIDALVPRGRVRSLALSELQEQATAMRIQHLESSLRDTLRTVPECRVLLDAVDAAAPASRSGFVALLGRVNELAQADSAPSGLVEQAGEEWREAQQLRWRLALSAGHVARREARRAASPRLSAEDLEQDGVLGLFGAATRFDPARGVRFAAYARWWVRAEINRSVQGSGAFRVSAASHALIRDARKVMQRDAHLDVPRPLVMVADELGVSLARLRDVLAASALRPVDDAEPNRPAVVAALVDEASLSPEERSVLSDVNVRLRLAVDTVFAPRERMIMSRRFGLGTDVVSIADIAIGLSLSTERVRQLEQQCLAVLRELFARDLDV